MYSTSILQWRQTLSAHLRTTHQRRLSKFTFIFLHKLVVAYCFISQLQNIWTRRPLFPIACYSAVIFTGNSSGFCDVTILWASAALHISVDCWINTKISLRFSKKTFLYRHHRLSGYNNGYSENTRVGTLIVATIYLQLIQNRYMFRSFTVLQCSHQHCVQPFASDVEVVGYL